MLRIDTRQSDAVTILDLTGELVFGPGSQSLAQHIKQLVADNRTPILVRLDGVSFIDSCGVGELIAGFTSVRKNGGTLKISGAGERVSEVLKIVRLPLVIDVYDSEAEALASFGDAD